MHTRAHIIDYREKNVPVVIWWTSGYETVWCEHVEYLPVLNDSLSESLQYFKLALTTLILLALKDRLLACYANHHISLNIFPHVWLPVKFCG